MEVEIIHKNSNIQKSKFKIFNEFIKFLQKKYPLKKSITIIFTGERFGKMTTGSRRSTGEILILTKKRITRDIFRTLAHEWVHEYQMTILNREKGPDIGGQNEDEANALSGQLIKMFEKENPHFEENMYE